MEVRVNGIVSELSPLHSHASGSTEWGGNAEHGTTHSSSWIHSGSTGPGHALPENGLGSFLLFLLDRMTYLIQQNVR